MGYNDNVVRIRKERQRLLTEDEADKVAQLAFTLLDKSGRELLGDTLQLITKKQGTAKRWRFIMISPEMYRNIQTAIKAETNSVDVATVWGIASTYMDWDTGEIVVDRKTLSKQCLMLPANVSTALTRLVELKALYRRKKPDGKFAYFVNPNIGWHGTEEARQQAVAEVKQFELFRANKDNYERI